jgi:hypothetical protein
VPLLHTLQLKHADASPSINSPFPGLKVGIQ